MFFLKKWYYRIYQKVLKLAMCFMDWKEPQILEGEGAVLKLPILIKEKGISLRTMAKDLDISISYLSDLEQGNKMPPNSSKDKYKDLMKIKDEDLENSENPEGQAEGSDKEISDQGEASEK